MCDAIELASRILNHTPGRAISRSRLLKTIYLCDWKMAIWTEGDQQATQTTWELQDCGPYSNSLRDTLSERRALFAVDLEDHDGLEMHIVRPVGTVNNSSFTEVDLMLESFVLSHVRDMNWTDFNRLVNSTHPVVVGKVGSKLDLPKLASQYLAHLSADERLEVQSLEAA